MVGDGVNDVPALKAARLAIAQASGAQMARAVADIVLVQGGFASLPPMVAEGQKVLRNLQRVAKLFVTKSLFAAVLVLAIGVTPIPYPYLPRHLTLVSSLTIGIPGFFLALAPSTGPWQAAGFLRGVVRFAAPAGLTTAAGVVAAYLLARYGQGAALAEARTVASCVLLVLGLYLIVALEAGEPRRAAAVLGLCGLMAALFALALLLPAAREFFALDLPEPAGLLPLAAGCALGLAGLWLARIRPGPS
jgi:magnesium-transporting ATPase (P-type)